jgi:hypothetical protein
VSTEDLWKVVGRARFDLAFGGKLKQDFAGTVHEAGYELSSIELADANAAVDRLLLDPTTLPPQMAPPSAAEQAQMSKLRTEQLERMGKLTDYMFETIKNTFRYASLTYKSITWMNWLTFVTGIGLFAFSAVYALYADQKEYSVLFAGLGVSSFVTSFTLRPPEQTQKALSNLVQTEIAFMNYFDQQSFWEVYANMQSGLPPALNPANIEKASSELMERARQTIDMLQRYVEDAPVAEGGPTQHSRRARKESGTPAPTISPPSPAKPS